MANEQLLTIINSILTATIALGGLILAQSRALRNRLARIAGSGACRTAPRFKSVFGVSTFEQERGALQETGQSFLGAMVLLKPSRRPSIWPTRSRSRANPS